MMIADLFFITILEKKMENISIFNVHDHPNPRNPTQASAYDGFRFLQAVEQIQLATENKITKEKVKEEEEEWQAVSNQASSIDQSLNLPIKPLTFGDSSSSPSSSVLHASQMTEKAGIRAFPRDS